MRPTGVRIVKKNGIEFEPELKHMGVDEDGMDCWLAVFEGRFVATEDKLLVAVLPPRTSVGLQTSLPPGIDPDQVTAHLTMRREEDT